ncbi:MAG: tRNA (adenosine(37)-N6)-dimethylallyltransferase MiaA [bacterium]|nr:tRNA (adenosine(37)-N6)-dimethylallyltransferase MiaA [bacterium]
MAEKKPPLVVIVGPTASGKSSLAIELAEEFHGEIVSADSRQVYRGMDIGTAKVLPEEQARVRHHLLDIAHPKQPITLAEYQARAFTAIGHILERGLLPLLVGGTGLYVQAVVENLRIPEVPPQPGLRARLETLDTAALAARLEAADPESAGTIDRHNRLRLIRAIEVTETAGTPISQLQARDEPRYAALKIGIRLDGEILRSRITERLDDWLRRGLAEEIIRLHKEGLSWAQIESFGLHYRSFAKHLQGELTFEEARTDAVRELVRYTKRQMTWFKRDEAIRWVGSEDEAQTLVSGWLGGRVLEPQP